MRYNLSEGKALKYEYLYKLSQDFELFTRAAYRKCSLSEIDKEILCEVGLPKMQFFLEFYTQADKPIYLAQYHKSYNVAGFAGWIVIGEGEYDSLLCIDPQGAIWLLDNYLSGYMDKKEDDVCFVNSSLCQLLECLAVYMEYGKQISEEEEHITKEWSRSNQIDELIDKQDNMRVMFTDKIREKFQKIDAQALAQEEYWWHFVLEELEAGVI